MEQTRVRCQNRHDSRIDYRQTAIRVLATSGGHLFLVQVQYLQICLEYWISCPLVS